MAAAPLPTRQQPQGGQVATRPVDALKKMLSSESVQAQFKNALANNSGLFIASLIDLYSNDDYLQKCEPLAVIKEALKAATLKLPINKSMGFAWIVPYWNNKTSKLDPNFQVGWRGFIQLAQRTGQYRFINCGVIYEGEKVDVNRITGMVKIAGAKISDEPIGFFAFFELLNGFQKMAYWTKEDAEAHAIRYNPECKKARALKGIWKDHFESRASTTVLKHLIKNYGIMSVDMISAVERDEDVSFDRTYAAEANTTPLNDNPLPPSGEVIDGNTGEVIQPGPGGSDQPPPPNDPDWAVGE